MPLSIIYKGEIVDFKFKQHKRQPYHYSFWLTPTKGKDIIMGQVFKLQTGWTAVSYKAHEMNNISGFKTRTDAAEYIVKLQGCRAQ